MAHAGNVSATVHAKFSLVRMGEAAKYASAAIADPDIRQVYVQMAIDRNKNPKRPFDMAVSDYCQEGNDLLWKKHMGEQEKPATWNMYYLLSVVL